MNPLDYFPKEFLSEDFRSNRPMHLGLPMDDQLTLQKHLVCLPPDLIEGRTVLDLGSFIGQTGHWCLSNGAKSYTGVEINTEFSNKSQELLNKYQQNNNWEIVNSSFEDYFENNNQTFDLIFAWGVLYYHHDHTWFLDQLAKRSDRIILSGRHPKILWRQLGTDFSDSQWTKLEYSTPYSEWQDRTMTGIAGNCASVKNFSASSSIGAVELIMKSKGFQADLSVYETLKNRIPEHFGMFRNHNQIGFYAIDFAKDSDISPCATMHNLYKNHELWNENYTPWNKI